MNAHTDNTDRHELLRQVEASRDLHARLIGIAQGQADDADREWFTDQGFGLDDGDDIAESAATALDEDVLESYGRWEGSTRGSADFKGCVVVTCIGGPHVELDTEHGQWVGYWAGETVKVSASDEVTAWHEANYVDM